MFLSDCISDYLRHIEIKRGMAKKTVKQYQAWLWNYHRWLQANGYAIPLLADFCVLSLRRYFYHQAGRGLRPRTLWSIFHPLRGLGAYLHGNGGIAENYASQIPLPKKDAAHRDFVDDGDIGKLVAACELQRDKHKAAFYRAVVLVLVTAGIRRQELLDLRVGDINLSEKSLLVRCGKGSKSRKVYLCQDCVDALREWLAVRRKDTRHDWLWAYDQTRRMHDNTLRNIFGDLSAIAGLGKPVAPHQLRHGAATRLLRSGANLQTISQFLGHSGRSALQTTAQYLHAGEEQLREVSEMTALKPAAATEQPGTKQVKKNHIRHILRR